MNTRFSIERYPGLSALGFAAEIIPGKPDIRVLCGEAVEADARGVIAGTWAGEFAEGRIEDAATSAGTALRLAGSGLIAVAGTASPSALFFCRTGSRLVVSNMLALALAAADDGPVTSYPFYPQDLCTFIFGSDRYRHSVPTRSGRLSVFYESMAIGSDLSLTPAPVTLPPRFPDYPSYRAYLLEETRSVFANAADATRRHRYRPMVACSAGYDSAAAAVIARDAGCREAFTFGQPVDRPDSDEDSGTAIGQALGLAVTEYKTHSYQARPDYPEIEFIASSFAGGQVYLAATGETLAGRIVVSGYGGDYIWVKSFGERRAPHFPIYIGGYSQTEFFARAPALDLAMPAVGARNFADIGAISRSAAMAPWSVGGDYDRPIARRIVEDAGIARGSFAVRKRRVTPDYDTLTRRAIDLDRFLSPESRAAFEKWFAARRPISRIRNVGHRLILDSIGRIVWSGKLARVLARCGISWPPFPARLIHWKVPIRKNAFLFNWAVTEQIGKHRAALCRQDAAPTRHISS